MSHIHILHNMMMIMYTASSNASYNNNTSVLLPAKWKLAHVAPLHNKRGAMNKADNYGPTSLTTHLEESNDVHFTHV